MMILRSWSLLIGVALAAGCATVTAPEGGPRDETPPQLILAESTPNLQTNFEKQRIELTFDEWVVVEDIFNQIVVSPPLEFRPEVTLKKRTVRFDFDPREELRDSATYTIQFGEAVKDLNEKNPAENLRFVFSTGDFLDSLTVSGNIVDAKTGEPVEDALFMLYDNLADSVVRTERPFYFSKTDKEGNFSIENVRAGTFKGFALKDVDFNYRYNLANEQIGFPDSLIVVSDSTQPISIRMFEETQNLRVAESNVRRYGRVQLTFNRAPERVEFSYQNVGQSVLYETDQDTVNVWYDLTTPQRWNLYVQQDTVLNDTVRVDSLARSAWLQDAGLRLTTRISSQTPQTLNPTRSIEWTFNHPIIGVDTSLIRLYEDTLRTEVQPAVSLDTLAPRLVNFRYNWKAGLPYELEVMPGAFTDFFGLANDTLVGRYNVGLRKNYGNLTLRIENLNRDTNYVVQLLRGSSMVDEFQIIGVTQAEKAYETLQPGDYSVQIITDLDQNGRWSPGDYDTRRQPETIFTKKLESLRANWEVEATISLLPE